jgi:hypothetical protein
MGDSKIELLSLSLYIYIYNLGSSIHRGFVKGVFSSDQNMVR